MDFKHPLKKALALLGSKKRRIDLIYTNMKNDRITDLVDKCKQKSKIISTLTTTASFPKSVFYPLIAPGVIATPDLTLNAGGR